MESKKDAERQTGDRVGQGAANSDAKSEGAAVNDNAEAPVKSVAPGPGYRMKWKLKTDHAVVKLNMDRRTGDVSPKIRFVGHLWGECKATVLLSGVPRVA